MIMTKENRIVEKLTIKLKTKAKFFEVVNGFIKSSLSFSEEFCLRGDSNEH